MTMPRSEDNCIAQALRRLSPARRKLRHTLVRQVADCRKEAGDGGQIHGAAFVHVGKEIRLLLRVGATPRAAVDKGRRMRPGSEEEQPQPRGGQKPLVRRDAEEIAGK